MKPLLLAILCSSVLLQAADLVKHLSTEATPFRASRIPLFRHGYLVLFPGGAFNGVSESAIAYGFTAYGPDGLFAYQKILQLPAGRDPVVRDVDFDSDGNAAVAASALTGPATDAPGFLNGILLLDRKGADAGFIDTGRYAPARIAIAPDGTIWTLGWQRDEKDYMILRQFAAEGKELKAYLPRSTFPPGLEPGTPGPGVSLEVTSDRLGILANSGETGASQELVELDLNGNVIERSRLRVPRSPLSPVFTADGHVYLAGSHSGEIYTLDRISHTWKLISKQPTGDLMGADGERLVYRVQSPGNQPIQLEWYPQP